VYNVKVCLNSEIHGQGKEAEIQCTCQSIH